MKKWMLALAIAVVLVVGSASVAFAAGLFETPAQTVANLTGQTEDDVLQARQDGTPYGAQAADAGKLDEFKAERLEQYRLRLQQAVEEGRLTQQEADELYKNMEQRMETCNGDGLGYGSGGGFGNGKRNGDGLGNGGFGFGGCMISE